MNCVYRFINLEEEIVYVGKTRDLDLRMQQHFKWGDNLKDEEYQQIKRVEFIDLKTESDMNLREMYYINKWKPIYNREDKGEGDINDIVLDEKNDKWKIYNKFLVSKLEKVIKEKESIEKDMLLKDNKINKLEAKISVLENMAKDFKIIHSENEVEIKGDFSFEQVKYLLVVSEIRFEIILRYNDIVKKVFIYMDEGNIMLEYNKMKLDITNNAILSILEGVKFNIDNKDDYIYAKELLSIREKESKVENMMERFEEINNLNHFIELMLDENKKRKVKKMVSKLNEDKLGLLAYRYYKEADLSTDIENFIKLFIRDEL